MYELGRLGALTPWVRCLVESIKSYFKLGALERVQLNLDALYHDAHIDPLKKGYLTVTVSIGASGVLKWGDMIWLVRDSR